LKVGPAANDNELAHCSIRSRPDGDAFMALVAYLLLSPPAAHCEMHALLQRIPDNSVIFKWIVRMMYML
jgi:hypothetical protein